MLVPDPAATRAHLLAELCTRFDARLLDERIALLTADADPGTPWLSAHHIEAEVPLRVTDVRAALREIGARRMRVHCRGVDFKAPELDGLLKKALRKKGPGAEVDVFATRTQDRPVAFVTRPVSGTDASSS